MVGERKGSGERQGQDAKPRQAREADGDLYSDLYDHAPIGYVTLDDKGVVLEANLRLAEMLGTQRQSLIDGNMAEIVAADDHESYLLSLREIVANRSRRELNLRLKRADSTLLWAHSRWARAEQQGAPACIRISLSDMTARMESEEASHESERRYRALIEAAPDMVFRIRADGTVLEFIPAVIVGPKPYVPPETFLGKRLADVLPADVASEMLVVIGRALSTQQVQTHPYSLTYPTAESNGVPVLQVFEGRVVPSGNGEVIWHARDITDKARDEELRTRFVEKVLSAQDEERQRLARELHDETGSSLATLKIGLGALDRVTSLEEARVEIRKLKRFADKTMQEVTWLARGLHPLALDELGFPEAIRQYVAEYSRIHPTKVDVHVGDLGDAVVSSVALALYRIIQEALANIAKHSRAENASLVIERQGPEVRVTVEDDGEGLSEAAHGRLKSGRGLGLQGIRERTALLGGTVKIESSGKGTAVFVRIPVRETRRRT